MQQAKTEKYWSTTKYRLPKDPIVQKFARSKIDIIRKYINLNGLSILDVGCGNGVFMHHLGATSVSRVVGIDISEAMLSKNTSGDLLMASAERIPFADNSFDLVFEANLLHHSRNPELILREMRRVARKYVVLIEPNRLNPVMFLFSLLNSIERGGLRSSRAYIKNLINSASLGLVHITTQGLVTQNNTPDFLFSFLKSFDKELFCAAYIVAVAQKQTP